MGYEVREWVKRPTQDLLESDTVSLPGSESSARVSEGGEHADDTPLLPPIAFVMPPRAVLVEGFASLTFGQCSSAEPW